MTKTPTAEEFCKGLDDIHGMSRDVIESHIEFAKLHVQAALEAADDNARTEIVDWNENFDGNDTPVYGVDSDSILNAYPLENIK